MNVNFVNFAPSRQPDPVIKSSLTEPSKPIMVLAAVRSIKNVNQESDSQEVLNIT